MVTLPPRLMIAAPASGAGKTTVTTGLLAALAARGLRASGHKVGPDYIDPGYHALATGRAPRNLDPVLVGADRVAPLFAHGAAGADIAVVEGVMGLFDGRGEGDAGSTAHVARLLDAPVVLVVDATGASRSVAALVHGFAGFDRRVRVAGVILNRVGSPRHEQVLRAALAPLGLPVLGALGREDAVAAPSRHLGLVPVAERAGPARAALDRLAALIARHCDLDGLLALARSAPAAATTAWDPAAQVDRPAGPPVTVALAAGAAFTFGYTENTELLTAAGAQVLPFDPLAAEALPAGAAALVLGGGFPELYAAELAANTPLRAGVARFAAAGRPVYAECAGQLYLTRELAGAPMCGVLPARAAMAPKLQLGYRDAVGAAGLVRGLRVTGHEFHRTSTDPPAGAAPAGAPAWALAGRPEGFVQGGVHASYLHLHWAGCPALPAALLQAAAVAR